MNAIRQLACDVYTSQPSTLQDWLDQGWEANEYWAALCDVADSIVAEDKPDWWDDGDTRLLHEALGDMVDADLEEAK